MGLKAGELDGNDNFVDPDCMAKYMEDEMPEPADPDDTGKGGRREFLIAISAGVIKYLQAHQSDSFVIDVTNSSGTLEILVD